MFVKNLVILGQTVLEYCNNGEWSSWRLAETVNCAKQTQAAECTKIAYNKNSTNNHGYQGHHHNGHQAARRPHIYCAGSGSTHLGLWQKLYDCSCHHLTTSCVFSNMYYWHFCQSPTSWLKYETGTF